MRNDPLGLGEVFDDEEMFGEDLEGDLVGGVFGDDSGCDPWSVFTFSWNRQEDIQEITSCSP